jgi:hypothetical protein
VEEEAAGRLSRETRFAHRRRGFSVRAEYEETGLRAVVPIARERQAAGQGSAMGALKLNQLEAGDQLKVSHVRRSYAVSEFERGRSNQQI